MAKIKPDYRILRSESLSTDVGRPKAKESIIWKEFLVANYNFVDECSHAISEDEVSDITMSLQNWTTKRNSNEYFKKVSENNFVKTEPNIGDIFLADLGLNFEKGYCRTVVIIEKIDNMLLVVPTTTQQSIFDSAFHPVNNNTGDKLFRRVYTQNGFDEKCVLLFNNIRIISKGRLIESNNSLKDSYDEEHIYKNIMLQVFENLLPEFYNDFNRIISENKTISRRIEELEEKLKKFEK